MNRYNSIGEKNNTKYINIRKREKRIKNIKINSLIQQFNILNQAKNSIHYYY